MIINYSIIISYHFGGVHCNVRNYISIDEYALFHVHNVIIRRVGGGGGGVVLWCP